MRQLSPEERYLKVEFGLGEGKVQKYPVTEMFSLSSEPPTTRVGGYKTL